MTGPNIEHPIMSNGNKETILISSKSKHYSFLSNCYCSDIIIDGKIYYHVTGYYQSFAYMGVNNKIAERIRNNISPIIAKKIAAENRHILTEDQINNLTKERRYIAMKKAIFIKFLSNSDLLEKLKDTKSRYLANNSSEESYWGIGKDGKGENHIGKILMELRSLILENDI